MSGHSPRCWVLVYLLHRLPVAVGPILQTSSPILCCSACHHSSASSNFSCIDFIICFHLGLFRCKVVLCVYICSDSRICMYIQACVVAQYCLHKVDTNLTSGENYIGCTVLFIFYFFFSCVKGGIGGGESNFGRVISGSVSWVGELMRFR